ncbi:LAMI_0A08284g1_1 [Lachancea mirantina]|uniref:phosphoserine phosphatase n=1 Tax=Lachancea mirantina TaxID=1230905 RepID=A0A1G4IR84_9SACH|nr:LAMI_0A08284g1_1 [Lachancea mirantina]
MTTSTPYVVTAIAHGATLENEAKHQIQALLKTAPGTVCEGEKPLSERAQDFYFQSTLPLPALKDLWAQLLVPDVDVVVQKNNEYRKQKGLVVFDMDSTLIYQEVIELIAAYANVEDKVAEITDRAMNNEIDFKQSLAERVRLLKGIKTATLYEEIKAKLRVTEGVPVLTKVLRQNGCKLAVLSGGFTPFANYMRDTLQLDYARANELATESLGSETVLSGHTIGEVVDGECKAQTLTRLAREYAVPVEATVMVGDGGNDLPAMRAAGFGIAWNAKPRVRAAAPCQLNTRSLQDALFIFGYTAAEIAASA